MKCHTQSIINGEKEHTVRIIRMVQRKFSGNFNEYLIFPFKAKIMRNKAMKLSQKSKRLQFTVNEISQLKQFKRGRKKHNSINIRRRLPQSTITKLVIERVHVCACVCVHVRDEILLSKASNTKTKYA